MLQARYSRETKPNKQAKPKQQRAMETDVDITVCTLNNFKIEEIHTSYMSQYNVTLYSETKCMLLYLNTCKIFFGTI